MSHVSLPRICALKTLLGCEFPTQSVYDIADEAKLDDRDRAYAVALVRGVEEHALTLDEIIKCQCRGKMKMSKCVLNILRISVLEMIFLDKQAFASIDQAVELTKKKARAATSLVNAILHGIDSNRSLIIKRIEKSKKSNYADELAFGFGFQKWFVEYVISNLGMQNALTFFKHCEEKPQISFFTNHLKNNVGEIIATDDKEIRELAKNGDVIISDASAQVIAKSFAKSLKNNVRVLEVGAGRGTKTALIQSFAKKENISFSTYDILDNSNSRIATFKERVKTNNLLANNIFCADAAKFLSDKTYDAIFIDAPCSGLGTIRRHPEIRQRISRDAIDDFAKTGSQILENVSAMLDKQGDIFYSTCTISNEENFSVVEKFLANHCDFKMTIIRESLLTKESDAHFCVKLSR